MTNYARIARNDDEPVNDEAEWVTDRAAKLMKEWLSDKAKVTEAIADALSDDGEDFFAGLMADLFISVEATDETQDMAVAAKVAWAHLLLRIRPIHRRDAKTAAQTEWDARLTGPEGDL